MILARRITAILLIASVPAPSIAQTAVEIRGLVVGRVYEVDPAKYQKYREKLEKQQKNPDDPRELLDPDEYLIDLESAVITARQLSTNLRYSSEFSNPDGEYMIRDSPAGAFDFTILHEDVEYPVRQNLDLNVELGYIAELCFVVDKQAKVAWMITEGMRRDPEMPPFVPERCQSALSACLAMLVGDDGNFPEGLLLLLAGSAAAAATIGILATGQTEASPPSRR
jgi:hypothetical protein